MNRIITAVVIAAASIGSVFAVAAGADTVARADSGDRGRIITSFGPIVSHDRTMRGTVVAYSLPEGASDGRWIVALRTIHNRRVTRARVRAVAYMPEDSTVPARNAVVRHIGRGRYEIDGLGIDRPGWWNVALTVARRGTADSLAFNLLVPESRPF